MSEDELDKVIWQESHAADERERHLDRLKELTGIDYDQLENDLLKKTQYANMLMAGRDVAREECDAALTRAEKAEAQVAMLRFVLEYVHMVHAREPISAMQIRVDQALAATTPEPTEEETA